MFDYSTYTCDDRPTAIVVCVDYADFLRLTLPMNVKHFSRVFVMTTPDDFKTVSVAVQWGAIVVPTRVFYDDGAAFNKGAAIEEAFELSGRSGWYVVLDADIVLPPDVNLFGDWRSVGNLYTPKRRMMESPDFGNILDWRKCQGIPVRESEEFAGYFQMFHSSDPSIQVRPWYPTNWRHAGGCDTEFWKRWPKVNRVRPPFEVLHLGADGVNWCGRVTPDISTGFVSSLASIRHRKMQQILRRREEPRGDGVPRFYGERIGEDVGEEE